jgi:hypothetical protein
VRHQYDSVTTAHLCGQVGHPQAQYELATLKYIGDVVTITTVTITITIIIKITVTIIP